MADSPQETTFQEELEMLRKEERAIQRAKREKQKERFNGSQRFGDDDFLLEDVEELDDASWWEVINACCCHGVSYWLAVFGSLVIMLALLYLFLFALELLGSGAKIMSGCRAGELFGDSANPVVGVMIGVLVTAFLQSSSTTTSIVVTLVGADALTIKEGVYFIMGANIGTAVTSTIVSLAMIRQMEQFERAVTGAAIHDAFNLLTVAILLPLEASTSYLFKLTENLVQGAETRSSDDAYEGPIKKLVSPAAKRVIIANKKAINKVALGESCGSLYPIQCEDGAVSYETCSNVGLIGCDKKTGNCPVFFNRDASETDDMISGGIVFFLALALIFVCITGICYILQKLFAGFSTRIVYKASNINGYLAIMLSAGATMAVQSSSVFTSAITPLAGIGVLRPEQLLPMTIGANIGTTLSSLSTAFITPGTNALQVALAHLFFNVTGFLIFYPIPFMRRFPIGCAKALGQAVKRWRPISVVYILFTWYVIPGCIIGIDALIHRGPGMKAVAVLLIFFVGVVVPAFVVWWSYFGGGVKCAAFCARRRIRQRDLSCSENLGNASSSSSSGASVNLEDLEAMVRAEHEEQGL